MIVYINTSGTAIAVQPSPVYQGSSLEGLLYLVAPIPTTNSVSVAFTLPNGEALGEYPMTSVSALPDVLNALGDEYSVWQWQVDDARITAEAGTVTAQFAVSYNGQTVTTSSINFTVQEGVLPLPPTTPSADEWQTLIELYGNLSGRVTALENRQTAKVLVDFTVNETTGEGVKYYSDGTTATVQFPTSISGGDVVQSEWLTVLSFTVDSWVSESDGTFSLAYGPAQTGFNNSTYMALLSSTGSATYKAGTDLTPTQRNGFYSQSDSVFIGSDGSLYLSANAQYGGRLILFGGAVFSSNMVKSIAIADGNLFVTYIDGSTETVETPWVTSAQVSAQIAAALTWKNYT